MDRTLKDYLGLSPLDAHAEVERLKQIVKEAGGDLLAIWHNDSVSDKGEWKGWRMVFESTWK